MLTRAELLELLRETDPARLNALFDRADQVRSAHVGDEVHLRGLIELSNHCVRMCGYCGIRAANSELVRYRMSEEEAIACAKEARALGYGTVVLQAGEDPKLTREYVTKLVTRIKLETGLAVTLSLGERDEEDLRAFRAAGADRYLLRFETSDAALFARIHPPRGDATRDRVSQLRLMRKLGYEIGSGVMVGIPGQSFSSLADDLLLFAKLDLDMVGLGPYLPHPKTPLGEAPLGEVPNSEEMTYKMVALTRLVCPEANIPSTTAIATVNRATGRELALSRGANVVMPNVTPVAYRALYEIYPGKACINETAEACQGCLARRIASLGRKLGEGPGSRQRSRSR